MKELLPYWRIYLARGSLLSLSISLSSSASDCLDGLYSMEEFFYEQPPPSNVMSESVVLRLCQDCCLTHIFLKKCKTFNDMSHF